jgi:steroid Delta-isomerase
MDDQRVQALLRFYQSLTPEQVASFGEHYADNAYFKDPFNEVHRLADIQAIFARMFRQLIEPRFTVKEHVGDRRGMFLVWDMQFRMRTLRPREIRSIHGVSHLRFGADGKVTYHRDYWDTGEELYAKLPLIGAGVGLLRRMLG